MESDELRITVRGKRALTAAQAAARVSMPVSTFRGEISRLKAAGQLDGIRATLADGSEPIDARTPLYWADKVERAMQARPGKGAAGRPRRVLPPVTADGA